MWLTASRCVSCTTWVYTFMVTAIWLCPRISMTTRGATPAAVSSVAAVPGVVQPDHPKAGRPRDTGERPVQVPRLDRPPGPGGEDVAGLLPRGAGPLAHGQLAEALPAQRGDADGGQGKGLLPAAPLGIILVGLSADSLSLGADADLPPVEVDVLPAQAEISPRRKPRVLARTKAA